MAKTKPSDPFQLIQAWRNQANLLLYLASTWEATLTAIKQSRAQVPVGLVEPMLAQAEQMLASLEGAALPNISGSAQTAVRDPDSYIASMGIVERISEQLREKNRRPLDLQNILSQPRDLIERALTSRPDLFQKLDQGWWRLKV